MWCWWMCWWNSLLVLVDKIVLVDFSDAAYCLTGDALKPTSKRQRVSMATLCS